MFEGLEKAGSAVARWLGVTSTLVATATAIFTTQAALSVNERNARDRFFEKQLEACTDLGDASIPLQSALSDVGTGFFLEGMGQKEKGDALLDRADRDVDKTYADYRKITSRLFVLYPDSFLPLEDKIVQYTPTMLRTLAERDPQPEQVFKTLRANFTDADIKLRQGCTSYLRTYAKANLMDERK